MKSASVKAFFSCSFREEDKEINDFFRAICEGLDITCYNVDAGYSEVPPDKARSMINEADAVIAIAPARTKFDGLAEPNSDHLNAPGAAAEEVVRWIREVAGD